jgi:uncharacterized YigZ family protein
MQYYNTIEQTNSVEFKERGSRFISLVYSCESKEDFKEIMTDVKAAYAKADHYCFAYRFGFDATDFRSSDAGEPAGTAGKQILGQIISKDLTNVLIVVVRYFGGTLLGVPGLINAYKTAAALVLQTTQIVVKERMLRYQLEFNYTQMNTVMRILKQARAAIISNESSLFTLLVIDIPVVEEALLLHSINSSLVQIKKL